MFLKFTTYKLISIQRICCCSFRPCSSLPPSTSNQNEIAHPKMENSNEFQRYFGPPLREEWSEEELRTKEEAIKNDNWTPVFRNRGLFKFFLIFRFNPILLATSFFIFSYKFGTQIADDGTIDLLKIWPELNLLILALITNHLIKKYVGSRIVGIISVDSATRSIYRVGVMTRWGQRKNEFARIGDFLPVAESNDWRIGKYAKFCWTFKSKKEFLILPTQKCEIVDPQRAYAIFGDMKYFEGMEDRGKPVMEELADAENRAKLEAMAKEDPLKLTAKTELAENK